MSADGSPFNFSPFDNSTFGYCFSFYWSGLQLERSLYSWTWQEQGYISRQIQAEDNRESFFSSHLTSVV